MNSDTFQFSIGSRFGDLLSDYASPNTSEWEDEASTRSYLRQFGEKSGIYILRHHVAYRQRVNDVFKVGRCDRLDRRFQDYRGAMTIVGFVQTSFPRVVEMIILDAVRRFVVHGRETVRLPLNALTEVCVASEREVSCLWMPRTKHIIGSDVFHKERDRVLRSIVKILLRLNIDIRSSVNNTRFLQSSTRSKQVKYIPSKVVSISIPKRPFEDDNTVATRKKRRTTRIQQCSQIECPYERLRQLCKHRMAISIKPSDAKSFDGMIGLTNADILARLDGFVAKDVVTPQDVSTLKLEWERIKRFDRPFWNGRAMSKISKHFKSVMKSVKQKLQSTDDYQACIAFVNECCQVTPQDNSIWTWSSDLFDAYSSWAEQKGLPPTEPEPTEDETFVLRFSYITGCPHDGIGDGQRLGVYGVRLID